MEQARMNRIPYLDRMANSAAERGREFAELIRRARQRKGWTQEQLVIESGVSKSSIVRWEGGRAERPDPDQVRALCDALGIDPRLAAVALGYLRPEDLHPEQNGAAGLDPAVAEVIAALEDPEVSAAEKEQWVDYLMYLRQRARDRRRTAG